MNNEIEDFETYDVINHPTITTKAFAPVTNFAKSRCLLIAISGGGGHIAAIKAFAEKYRDKCETLYSPVPYHSKVSSITGMSIFLASYASYFPQIQSILSTLDLPLLPNHEKLVGAIRQLHSDSARVYVDMLLDVHPSGYESAAIWNIFQREDMKSELRKLVELQAQNDMLFYPIVHDYFYNLLVKAYNEENPYTEVISTQVAGIAALCDAVIKYNEMHGENIKIHQYMTDLPTKGAIHFSSSLSRLTVKQQQVMNVYAVGMDKSFLRDFFIQSYFNGTYNLNPKDNPMIRQGFTNPENDNSNKFSEPVTLVANLNSIKKFELKDEKLIEYVSTSIIIPPDTKIACIMIGSQAGTDTVRYISSLIYNGIEKVFVFGGDNAHIAHKIKDLLRKCPTWTDNIILLSNQDASFICAIKTRCNVIVTGSGGLSVMEQMAMNFNPSQIVLIHCADTIADISCSGITWEDCNADELIDELKDKLIIIKVTPNIVFSTLSDLLGKDDIEECPKIEWQII